jgi:hypothetical protein
MSDEQKTSPIAWTRVIRYARMALLQLLEPMIPMALLAVAMIEALLSPFLGWRFALASLATGVVAIGLIVAIGASWVEMLGCWLQRIHEQLVGLYDEEIAKLTKSQQRTEPEKPGPGPSWRM